MTYPRLRVKVESNDTTFIPYKKDASTLISLFSLPATFHLSCITLFLAAGMLRRARTSACLWNAILLIAHPAALVRVVPITQNPFDVRTFPAKFVSGTGSIVSWTPTSLGTVSLMLVAETSYNIRYVSTIAHFIENKGSFTWTPSAALEYGDDYTLSIISDVDNRLAAYSPRFTLEHVISNRQYTSPSFTQATSTSTKIAPTFIAPTSTTPISATPTSTSSRSTSDLVVSSSEVTKSPTSLQALVTVTTVGPTSSATSTEAPAQISSSSSLSTSAAIGIGIGATIITLLLIAMFIVFFIHRRRRQQRQQPLSSNPTAPSIAEFGARKPLAPLSPEEYAELDRRRRAAELQGQSMGVARRAEFMGRAHPWVELEALRGDARMVHELGGQPVLSDIQPTLQR